MKGLFIPEITAEMFRNGCLEGIEALMAEGEIYDIDYIGWIPCSERLPSVSGTYIVTTVKGAVCLDHFYADSYEPHWSYWRTRTTLCWMPLPKPYREDGER